MALHHLVDLFDNAEEAGEIDLAVVLQRNLGENSQRLAELVDVDLRRITLDITFRLQLLYPHQARAGRQIDKLRQLDIGDATVFLQFIEDLDIDPVKFHHVRNPFFVF
ncbi:hypothetical protein D3C78_1075840 [compost metagenome]